MPVNGSGGWGNLRSDKINFILEEFGRNGRPRAGALFQAKTPSSLVESRDFKRLKGEDKTLIPSLEEGNPQLFLV